MPDSLTIAALLDAGRETELLGVPESDQLDFKSQPYRLGGDKGRWELCKDVAALANIGGGDLVIGVETEVPDDREEEIASAIKPFPSPLVLVKQYRDALDASAGIYPVLRDVEIRKFERAADKALALISVPPQAEDDLPFIVLRMVEGDEKRGVGIGVPFRSGSHTYWEPAGQLHRDLSDGRRFRRLPDPRLLGVQQRHAEAKRAIEELTATRLQEIEQYMGWTDVPTLLLTAVPVDPQSEPIEGFYDRDRVRGAIERPPELRHAGFGLAYPGEARNEAGSLINARPGRTVLWVDPDGKAFAAAAGSQGFLTRSGGSRIAAEPEARTINPTVLVEWTYLFCRFVTESLAPSVAGDWRLSARLRGALSRPWALRLLGGNGPVRWSEGSPPGLDDWQYSQPATLDPATDAFSLLARIYGLFGVSADQIPYAVDGRVDPAALQAIR